MLAALAGLGSMAMSGLSSVGGWLGSAGSWIGSNLGGIGSALGGIGGLAGSLFGSSSSSKNAKKMAALQYAYQKRAWQEGPSLQRKGLEAAGYNPMLALNGNSASFMPSVGYSPLPDMAGSAKAMSSIGKDILGLVDAQRKNVEADTKLKEGQLSAVETQRLQTEANTSLLQSQAERSDLAYGRDIIDTITGIAGTGASLYSAKAMADVAKANALVNARNQTLKEAGRETSRTVQHYDKHGKLISTDEISESVNPMKKKGVPAVDSSAKGAKPNAASALGASARRAGRIVGDIAKLILFPAYLGDLAADEVQPFVQEAKRLTPEQIKRNRRKDPIQFNSKRVMVFPFGM